ncbi:Nuclear factor related to kappa-B-binding protein [Actinidia chinensis var. chinensis]|uniref:Nuclear factor related to kappa-B-binding protein n=1 Tax=Actinidia chinensis var. chinensis TaxID=1590841 RepID=A0A2R6PWS1_ACTCC|nr:Nuclear factor related to kappa-B-binding protein [Actinidia chinensis var. chinensis]
MVVMRHKIRGKSEEKTMDEMVDERDINAAHVLVEMANCVSWLPNNNALQSCTRSPAAVRIPDNKFLATVLADDYRQDANRLGGDGKMKAATGEKLNFPLSNANHVERKQKKRKLKIKFSLPQANITEKQTNSMHEMRGLSDVCGLGSRPGKKGLQTIEALASDGHDGLRMGSLASKKMKKKWRTIADDRYLDEWNESDHVRTNSKRLIDEPTLKKKSRLQGMKGLSDVHGLSNRLGKKGRPNIDSLVSDGYYGRGMGVSESKKMTKKRKSEDSYSDGGNEYDQLHYRSKKLIHEPNLKKKLRLLKADAGTVYLGREVTNAMLLPKNESVDDRVAAVKPAKRQKLPVITPTLHTGFSFSIIHLLSSVRMSLVTPPAEYFTSARGEYLEEENGNLPSLTMHQIVWCVRSNPGDPCILETQQPLVDLVRAVLKIFSSRTSPLGAKAWKPLTTYSKSNKKWSWIGPVSYSFSIDDCSKVETSSEAWDLPYKTIVNLVDCFANWLKTGQETLKQIGCLPTPPLVLMQPTNAEERFKDLRAQRSLSTISPSSDEIRAYFRREEALRHLIPERTFSYTTLDGRKSTVAPLRRCSGKPSARARDHFMLTKDRPPHVTILCLVRDAAARLPGSIGTRADVCTLVRDSQYIVDEISDLQVNQVVSGALDRLHYELDPCVKYDRDRHLWVYLHGEREEEDFESDGCTSSQMKCTWQDEMLDEDLD